MTEAPRQAAAPGPRQAVVLIHGIGEQRPMETLRRFVATFLRAGTYYSKPDMLSESFELRRLKLRRFAPLASGLECVNEDWPETDFYEYYWAHQMYGTTVSHITNWLWQVMQRGRRGIRSNDPRYHRRLKTLVPLVWLIAVGALVAVIVPPIVAQLRGVPVAVVAATAATVVATVASTVWGLARLPLLATFVDVVGDAARYFDVNPKNVARRYDILRGGVDMLRKLHEERDLDGDDVMYRYGRVVLIGHSLGSVISYDILRHYWHEVNGSIEIDPADFADVENFAGSNGAPPFVGATPYTDPARYRRHQHEALCKVNSEIPSGVTLPAKDTPTKGAPHARWLVTDLVTLGCPMTYAPILLAENIRDLKKKLRLRELPTCPPDRSRNLNPGHFTVKLSAEADRISDFDILPQGAYFALTRWTNLFFDNDPVGGPVGRIFGNGVDDVEMGHGNLNPIRAHVSYWDARFAASKPCRERLRSILMNR